MSLINKYNISEEDLNQLREIEAKKKTCGIFEKEKLKAASLKILKPYKVKFLDLGNLLNEIRNGNIANAAPENISNDVKEGASNLTKEKSDFSNSSKDKVTKGSKNQNYLIIGVGIFLLIFLLMRNSSSIPDEWRDKKLYSVSDRRDWIIIRTDDSFTLHEYIPNSEQTFEWNGKIDGMTLKSSKSFSYQGRNDFKPTQIDPNIEVMDIAGKFLRINFEGFSTISGSNKTDGRNYVP